MWRYASAADVDKYYGERPPQTIRAAVVTLDDEPVGIAGLSYDGDRYTAFSEFKPELEPHLKSMPVLRAVKAVQKMILTADLPVIVQNTTNPKLLERLGFIEIQPGVHLCRS
jgi:hypothetical protein